MFHMFIRKNIFVWKNIFYSKKNSWSEKNIYLWKKKCFSQKNIFFIEKQVLSCFLFLVLAAVMNIFLGQSRI